MRKILAGALFVFMIFLGIGSAANALVIDFDDLTPNPSANNGLFNSTYLPTNYMGFTWSGGEGDDSWVVSNNAPPAPFSMPAHSAPNYAWSNGGRDLYLSSATPFDLDSVWAVIGAAYNSPVVINGYANNVLTYQDTFQVGYQQWQLIPLNFVGINEVTFSTNNTYNLLLDDISIDAASVPGPATLLLFAPGLAGLVALKTKYVG